MGVFQNNFRDNILSNNEFEKIPFLLKRGIIKICYYELLLTSNETSHIYIFQFFHLSFLLLINIAIYLDNGTQYAIDFIKLFLKIKQS